MLGAFVCPPRDPIFLSHPIAQEGSVTEGSVQALACVPALQCSSVRADLHKLVCMQLSEKSESASLCLQDLGAAGLPPLLISQPELFIHFFFFLTEVYIYAILFKWM